MVSTNGGKEHDQNITDPELEKRKSDATSKETVSDLREGEKGTNTTSNQESGPSPDGALDESDEIKDAGPM